MKERNGHSFTRGVRTWAGTGALCALLLTAPLHGQRQVDPRGIEPIVTVVLSSPQRGRTLAVGETIEWQLRAFVNQESEGLAVFSSDLSQDPDNPDLFDLPPASGVPVGMTNFDRPNGFSNPGQDFTGSGFTGIQVGDLGSRNLTQVGGAQNIFGVAGPCFGPNLDACMGQVVDVEIGVGQSVEGQLIAQGSFPAPATSGRYVFRISSVLAYVVTDVKTPPQPSKVARAAVDVPHDSFFVNVITPFSHADHAGSTLTVTQTSAPPPLEAPVNEQVLVPAEGASITQIHTRFRWPAIPDVTGNYVLQTVEDDASSDPFAGGFAITTHIIDGAQPRAVVKQGLEFGKSYAWRAYPEGGQPSTEIHRFDTAPLPTEVPTIGVTIPVGACPVEPGVTMFNLRGASTNNKGLIVGVDESGKVVYFFESLQDRVNDVRQIHTGQLLVGKIPDTLNGPKGRALVLTTRGGKTVWSSPDLLDGMGGDLYAIHHEAAVGPDNHYLLLVRELQDRTVMGVTSTWRGDRIILFDRHTSEVRWSWNTFDHYSLDDVGIDWSSGQPYPPGAWVHGNAAFYNPVDGDVYFSGRNISRVSRIHFDTGAVIYNMGMDMPSGDTDFGDGLFSNQHAPQVLPNGNMVLFDNGNLNTPLPLMSCAKEIAFDDPDNPTSASIVWQYCALGRDGVTPLFTPFVGDADRLDGGNTLVTFGAAALVDEVCPAGNLARRLDIGGVGTPDAFLYRAHHFDELIVGARGDVDEDEDVDLLDLAAMSGAPSIGVISKFLFFPNSLLDMDNDGGLDRADVSLFLADMTGPGR